MNDDTRRKQNKNIAHLADQSSETTIPAIAKHNAENVIKNDVTQWNQSPVL